MFEIMNCYSNKKDHLRILYVATECYLSCKHLQQFIIIIVSVVSVTTVSQLSVVGEGKQQIESSDISK